MPREPETTRLDGLDDRAVTAGAAAIRNKIFVPEDALADHMPREEIIDQYARRLASYVLRAAKRLANV